MTAELEHAELLQALADEQAALRRVAELVARAAPPTDVFTAVATEASGLLDAQAMTLTRFSGDTELVVVAVHGGPAPIGQRIAFEPGTLPDRIRRGAAVVRVDDYTRERDAELAATFNLAAAVSAPIAVAGTVWGMLTATSDQQPLRAGTEGRLEQFAQLVAAALGNSQAHAELRAMADEQAALHRVAELVARGAAPDEVFVAVTNEASGLLGDLAAALMLYDAAGAVVVASCNCPAPVGLHVPFAAGTAIDQLFRTGRPAQVRTYEGTSLADITQELGIASTTAVPITVEGRVRAALVSSSSGPPIPPGVEARLAPFAELAAVAIANAETKAKLTASRARVVATADEARRRLQRDVHDGAQQRLVHTIIALKLARQAQARGDPAIDLIDEALTHAERASTELRDMVHGILPAALTHGGLRTGLESLIDDLPLAVDVHVATPRLPPATETTAYFVVAEALTNVVKHAHARQASVHVALEGDVLTIEVRDDGVGGADPARGTGLTGLLDRIDAAEGTLAIASPAQLGTTLRVSLPVEHTRPLPPPVNRPIPGRPSVPSGQPDPGRRRHARRSAHDTRRPAMTTPSHDDLASKLERTEIQRSSSSIPGREIVQVLTLIPAGVESGWHTHPGEEVGYIVAGTVQMMIKDRPTLVLNAGEGFLIPPGTPHNALDLGPETGRMLSTYIVEVGKPIASFTM